MRLEGRLINLWFLPKPKLGVKLVLLALLSLSMITADMQYQYVDRLRTALVWLVSPLQYVVHGAGQSVNYLGNFFAERQQLTADNEFLSKENLVLSGLLLRMQSLQEENQRLKVLLRSSARAGDRVLVANLLSVDTNPYSHRLTLDKGSDSGVFQGQSILDANGVMGQIVEVGPNTSVALLITDINHSLPVRVSRSGLRGIVNGSGRMDRLTMPHVTSTSDLEVNDIIITSGLGEVFPEGYPVGRVTEIIFEPGDAFVEVYVQPMAHLANNREVLLVWPGHHADSWQQQADEYDSLEKAS